MLSSASEAPTREPSPKRGSQPRPGSGRTRREVERRLRWSGAIAAILGLACVFGVLDTSIRNDPFTPWPGLWQWLSKPQPHPALGKIPVLPMGAAGIFSWRPTSTAWISEGMTASSAAESPRPTAARSLFAGEAWAQSSSGAPRQQQQQFQAPVKGALNKADTPPELTLVPDLNSDPKVTGIAQLSPVPGLNSAHQRWAICDVTGATCLRSIGEFQLSTDGGARWTTKTVAAAQASGVSLRQFIIVRAGRRYLASGRDDRDGKPEILEFVEQNGSIVFPDSRSDPVTGSIQEAAEFFLSPFMALELLYPNQRMQELQQADAAQTAYILKAFLRSAGLNSKAALAGVIRNDASNLTLHALFSKGTVLRSQWTQEQTTTSRITHKTDVISLNTAANLRSIHFQPDGKIGWVSSGWNDGNEEGPYPAIFQTLDAGKSWTRLSYRALPAPWALFVAMPAFVLAFFFAGAAWTDYRTTAIDEGIAGAGTSDAPIGWNDPDILDLKPLALALSRFVRNTNTTPPLTIAVTGPWGSGKSSLMNLVAEDLRRRGASPVWFNAWHHQKEEHILAALLENIRSQAIPPTWRLSGLIFRLRLVALRMGKNFVPLLLAVAVITAVAVALDLRMLSTGLSDWLANSIGRILQFNAKDVSDWLDKAVGIGTGALLLVLIKLYGTLNLKPSELMATLRGNAKVADFSAQLGFRYKFAKEFDAAGRALRSRSNPGLVIFIDDLDRCAPDNLMEVLESINFLATAGPCFIFLGMDEPKVVDIIAKKLSDNKDNVDKERARQYLKKLINLTVPIPEVDEARSVVLSIGAEHPEEPVSPWPKRIRSVLRSGPDSAVPALILIALIGLFAPQLSNAPTAPSTESARTAPQAGSGTAAPRTDGSPPAIPSPGQAPAAEITIPQTTVDKLGGFAPGWPLIAVGLTVIVVLLLFARRMTTAKEDQVEDSVDFRDALRIWHPTVFASDPTPRGVKRHQNRLRLQAMRLRPAREVPDLLDRWFLARKDAAASGNDVPISEPTLVALGAIDALYGDVPIWSVGAGAPTTSPPGHGTDDVIPDTGESRVVAKCRTEFQKAFPGDWPPTQENVKAFRALRRALQN